MHPFSTNQLFSTRPSSARGFAWSDQPGHHTDLMFGDRKILSMKPIRALVCGAKCCLAAILGSSLLTISVSAAPALKAFPTAEGFGANALGGRGGRVIEVTTLEDSGPGSLRAAMEASGPRIVVFRVSGTIALKDAIRVRTPYLTVAGQTSPGGVQIRGMGQPEGDWGVWCVNGAH